MHSDNRERKGFILNDQDKEPSKMPEGDRIKAIQNLLIKVRSEMNEIDATNDKNEDTHKQLVLSAIDRYHQYMEVRNKQEMKLKKPKRTQYRGFTADEFYDVTSVMNAKPPEDWTHEQIVMVINRISEVSGFLMRGSPEVRVALSKFHRTWIEFVNSRSDVKELLDPEVVVFDIPWVAPSTWDLDKNRANLNLTNELTGLPISVTQDGLELPLNAVAAPPGNLAEHVFITNGTAEEATNFGGFMFGKNFTSVRGYWRINTAAPPIYY